jgi:NAD(P)H-hydrate epimerase
MLAIESAAKEELGIPTLLMMENAAIKTLGYCLEYLGDRPASKVIVICGPGSNGGDGLALARHLRLSGIDTGIIFVGDMGACRGDALLNLEISRKMDVPIECIPLSDTLLDVPYTIETCDLVVDALFGTGLGRKVEGSFEYIIDMINSYAKHVISIDVPSGVNSDTGQIMGCAVKASQTVTLGLPKIGIILHPGAAYAGKIEVADISIPQSILTHAVSETSILSEKEIKALLPGRKPRSNKGAFGKVYGFAGSASMPGAAVLSATAAYKVGAGCVCACLIPQTSGIMHSGLKEAVTRILPEKGGGFCRKSLESIQDELRGASVIYVGPGLGRSSHVSEFVFELLSSVSVPIVIDADALNAISEDVNILKKISPPCIITPHPGEMSRLTGLSVQDILDDTFNVAKEFSREFEVITLLKDAHTIIASPTGHTYINTTGSTSLSKAGTGDVLTGIIAGFISQGMDVFSAGMLGSYIHGRAGEMASASLSDYGVLASDVLDLIPKCLNSYNSITHRLIPKAKAF